MSFCRTKINFTLTGGELQMAHRPFCLRGNVYTWYALYAYPMGVITLLVVEVPLSLLLI